MINSFIDGVLFFIAGQLLIVALMHFVERKSQKSIFLGLICLVNGLWFFYFIFHDVWKSNVLLGILIGPDKTVFIPILIYFYLKSIRGKLITNFVGLHLLFPLFFYAVSLYLHFSPEIPWSAHSIGVGEFIGEVSVLILVGLVYFWLYFFKSKKEIEYGLKTILIPKVHKRIRLFFYAFYLPLLIIPLFDTINALLPNGNDSFYSVVFEVSGQFLYNMSFFLSYLLSLYAITELGFIRKLLFPSNALLSKNLHHKKAHLDELIANELLEKKRFQNATISAESFANEFGLAKKELLEHLELTRGNSFIGFINSLRVDEFKTRVKDSNNEHLDLIGLAKECGFQSKTTFFRVFKEMEGITPNEYKKQL